MTELEQARHRLRAAGLFARTPSDPRPPGWLAYTTPRFSAPRSMVPGMTNPTEAITVVWAADQCSVTVSAAPAVLVALMKQTGLYWHAATRPSDLPSTVPGMTNPETPTHVPTATPAEPNVVKRTDETTTTTEYKSGDATTPPSDDDDV